jgi:hypothetical protein
MVAVWGLSFWLLAGYIPPPAPDTAPEQTLAFYMEHNFEIRLGLMLSMFGSALLIPWSAAIAAQMQRMEGKRNVLAMTQLGSGIALSVEFIVPIMVWQAAAYHASPERTFIISVLQDMGWLMFVGVVSSIVVQVLAFGAAILLDSRTTPVLPRWTGYFCVWVAILLSPAGLVPLFHTGPFTWNGLFSWWIPLTTFCIWILTMTLLLLGAIKADTPAAEHAEATV